MNIFQNAILIPTRVSLFTDLSILFLANLLIFSNLLASRMETLSLDLLKAYVGVQFANNTNDIVPKSWITIYNSKVKKL